MTLERHKRDIDGNRVDGKAWVTELKEDFTERIESIDEFCRDAIAVVERSMGRVESLAKDNVNKKEDDLKIMFDNEIYAVRQTIAENTKDMKRERDQFLEKNIKTMDAIRKGSIKFLTAYDDRMLSVEGEI